MQIHDLFHHLAHGLAAVARVQHAADHRQAADSALQLGIAEQLVAELALALFELHGLGPQHQVREVERPLVRRHVGTLGLVAQVAQVALVDDLPVVVLGHTVHLHGLGLIDQVEQRGVGVAQRYAAAAAVADVEDPLHLFEEFLLVVEVGVLPVEGVACRGLETAFSHGGSPSY